MSLNYLNYFDKNSSLIKSHGHNFTPTFFSQQVFLIYWRLQKLLMFPSKNMLKFFLKNHQWQKQNYLFLSYLTWSDWTSHISIDFFKRSYCSWRWFFRKKIINCFSRKHPSQSWLGKLMIGNIFIILLDEINFTRSKFKYPNLKWQS